MEGSPRSLKTCSWDNRIIVLDKGVIAEDGTYDELINQNGLFAELVKRQMAEEA
jgi:ABC-type multidrug transport system fused ATPase/permease subunit